jgi:peptidyl-prolyl cis-trans isomerase A (cyclophilin A)
MRFAILFVLLALGGHTAFAQASRTQQAGVPAPVSPRQKRSILLDPGNAFWKTRAPDTVTADVETAKGTFTLELPRSWAPRGVDRFYNLARAGYYDDSRFYRVIYGFVAQFGLAGDPVIARAWSRRTIPADPVREKNVRGTLTYAQFKPTDRTTNAFINLRDNPELDTLRFVPIGRVVQGMSVVDSLYALYGDFPSADEPLGNPKRLYGETNKYLDEKFPNLDRIVKVTIRP